MTEGRTRPGGAVGEGGTVEGGDAAVVTVGVGVGAVGSVVQAESSTTATSSADRDFVSRVSRFIFSHLYVEFTDFFLYF
jgi:hypothetical protein